ncbi:hypothetical protein [Spirochaeta isovalerica]|uniref:FlgN protein n=1 Tax=Spirochaeta isovalerica TaxID=150 RepID=A0A841R4A4_9SPIO|nr:hypothetical protein [Spirochaeta isovalerica]MBB6478685.1 hypothetical protein [Spirochaeta isovalerica]
MELMEIEEQLGKIMTDEISLFSLYREEFGKMEIHVRNKDWVSLQRSTENMRAISEQISRKDNDRDGIYRALCEKTGSSPDDSFYSVAARAYGPESREICDIFRIVKNEARSLKVMNQSFEKFIRNRKNLISDIMEELVPDRKGSIYNRRGLASHDNSSSSLVLNKHL